MKVKVIEFFWVLIKKYHPPASQPKICDTHCRKGQETDLDHLMFDCFLDWVTELVYSTCTMHTVMLIIIMVRLIK